MSEFCDYVVYADESGDHGLGNYSPEFPVFVLSFCIFHKQEYLNVVVPGLQRIKFKHFGHDTAIFHEREIRKSLGDFEFLKDRGRRAAFMDDVSQWVAATKFTIIGVVIRKPELIALHEAPPVPPLLPMPPIPPNPYYLAMQYGLERVDRFLKKHQQNGRLTHVVCEARGKKEDDELRAEFARVCAGDNYAKEQFNFCVRVVDKKINSCGLQLADLTARPIGLHVLNPEQPNRAFEIIEPKLDRAPDGRLKGCGLKCYPEKQAAPADAEATGRPGNPVPPL